jgi:hypothetical protein
VFGSKRSPQFRALYDQLPAKVRKAADASYELWKENPWHPSLHFKQIQSQHDVYSVRIGQGHRALGVRHGETMIWFWIGGHDEYVRVIKTL